MDFSAKYETPVKVGEGSFGTVYRIKNKETGEYAALKVIKEKKVWEMETALLQEADHPLFPGFIDAGES
ncbi:MAG: hypothetical protein IKQ28_06175, partial [Lachnospiraceae bacterium]|nr:hypothetical protein [Lachnospiraceae bacterium]